MTGPFDLERRRESRLRRFGIGLGLVLALLFHLALFWGPRVSYRPALEEARVRRVLVARPYRPQPPPPPPEASRPAPSPAKPPPPVERLPQTVQAAPAAGDPGGLSREPPRAGLAEPARTERDVPVTNRPEKAEVAGAPPKPNPDAWEILLSELQERQSKLAAREEGFEVAGAGGQEGGEGEGPQRGYGGDAEGNGYLDPRMRVSVVSYPPTSVERGHPGVAYPDLRFHRAQLQAGICRVWYRVWTDGRGEIVRRQLKTPETREDLERYAPFVEAVTSAVEGWDFDRVEAEVHVDVLFEIE